MSDPPVVSGISPREGPPGTRVTIRGENLGSNRQDVIGLCSISQPLKLYKPHPFLVKPFSGRGGEGDQLEYTARLGRISAGGPAFSAVDSN